MGPITPEASGFQRMIGAFRENFVRTNFHRGLAPEALVRSMTKKIKYSTQERMRGKRDCRLGATATPSRGQCRLIDQSGKLGVLARTTGRGHGRRLSLKFCYLDLGAGSVKLGGGFGK
jgi:hypothetical protein